VPVLLISVLVLMILPMPAWFLDLFFTFNIVLSMIVLMVSVYALRPLDFSVFPTVLLVATLLRLALNVASTRVVLLEGHTGGDAAGKVIEAFGSVVIGGNYAVGIVVFLILMIINFVVVTKGAGRISEVSARFTLDAMPGKQMAIDADMNAGLIDQNEARQRREDVADEADFYGSMDGASKFVRGDAIAGILILIINLIGGFAIGMGQHDLSFGVAAERYTLLTIGDGLVAQIPSLLLSTAAAMIVTRANTSSELKEQVSIQLLGSPRAIMVAGGIMAFLGIIPGMPWLPFLVLASVTILAGYLIDRRQRAQTTVPVLTDTGSGFVEAGTQEVDTSDVSWDDVEAVDPFGIEVGLRLVSLVKEDAEGGLLNRVRGVRRKVSKALGFLVPAIHIRDNLELAQNHYRFTLAGVSVAEAEVHTERVLAINPGQVQGSLQGIHTKDPAFSLDALWIEEADREQALVLGYTVVDCATVIATHLDQVLMNYAADLLGHDQCETLIERVRQTNSKLVEETIPDVLNVNSLLGILQQMLRERVAIRDVKSILEALATTEKADTATMLAVIRQKLSRQIVFDIAGSAAELSVATLSPQLQQLFSQNAQQPNGALDPVLVDRLVTEVNNYIGTNNQQGLPTVLVVPDAMRPLVAKLFKSFLAQMSVLGFGEIPDDRQLRVTLTLGGA